MLTNCKECGLQISDKAIFCPHCGYPIQPSKISRVSRKKKLPNGFGQITKLKNQNLRKPYRAMVTVGHTELGRPISRLLKPQSYFSTYNEAYEALLAHAKSPYDESRDLTLEELYAQWNLEAFQDLAKSTSGQYKTAWGYCGELKRMKVRDIRPKNIKECVCHPSVPDSIRNIIKILLNQLFDYATENEISDKNYARITKIKRPDGYYKVKNPHRSFSDFEISVLWDNKGQLTSDKILIQCYTGLRPSELCYVRLENINLQEDYFIAGSKTKAGKNRKIPIHPLIKDLIEKYYKISVENGKEYLFGNGAKEAYTTYRHQFNKECDRLGLSEHTPHDPRKFFVTTAKKYHVDEYAIKRIVGHEIADLTEKVYTERNFEWLRSEMLKIVYE